MAYNTTAYEKKKAEEKALEEAKAEHKKQEAKRAADAVTAFEKSRAVTLPPSAISVAIEARLLALELLVGTHSSQIATMQVIPTAFADRLHELEVLAREQASTVVTRATEQLVRQVVEAAAAAKPATARNANWRRMK